MKLIIEIKEEIISVRRRSLRNKRGGMKEKEERDIYNERKDSRIVGLGIH